MTYKAWNYCRKREKIINEISFNALDAQNPLQSESVKKQRRVGGKTLGRQEV